MVKRRSLADLLVSETQRLDELVAEASESQTHAVTESVTHVETTSAAQGPTASVSSPLPKYRQLVRKEARLHDVQYDELTRLARELNRRKRGAGEIITANTLLRIATELLLARKADLHGDTEEDLLDSIRPPR